MSRNDLSVIHHLFGTEEMQQWLLQHGTREQLMDWLIWNDGNGVYSDQDCDAEGYSRLTLETSREAMKRILSDES